MASRSRDHLDVASAVGWRLLLAAGLAVGLARTVADRHLAVALVLGAALILTLLDLRSAFAGCRASAAAEHIRKASDDIRLEQATALLDAVTVALFALDESGRVRFMNRSARALAGREVGRLQDVSALGVTGAEAVLVLPVGGRQLLTLTDGRSVLVWVEKIVSPGAAAQRLVSMQPVAGELDAVQVGAWHRMTRVLAHEMMNSLTPIASLAESLEHQAETLALPQKVASAVATIARRSRHLMGFVERYRAVVDLPAPNRADLDAGTFLADLDRLVGPGLRDAGTRFVVRAAEPDLSIRADRTLLEQAVLNLLKNAAEAVAGTPDPEVELSCTRQSEGVAVMVRDNGRAVPNEQLEEIFVPFFTTKVAGGGIGLTLARQVALAHGGRLTATRRNERGMEFELALPG